MIQPYFPKYQSNSCTPHVTEIASVVYKNRVESLGEEHFVIFSTETKQRTLRAIFLEFRFLCVLVILLVSLRINRQKWLI
ncbi:unnamed protein product [Acanthoscelides obtectus]|uniref:Uncharacterized protein n=1 Tax=Acanthoscelides obtectus TaxID=200917 RepID=A0A9P0JU50_ACAOB|nr:unnamed protein product [Acanthoscelides obtectus]CAK1637336.1 hypothetical protein AOBTE_LOCUS9919 [Acanthoscelides obtectus]